MKKQDKPKMAIKPKTKLDSLMSEQKRLVKEKNFSRVNMSDKAMSKEAPFSKTLGKMARMSDSLKVINNSKLIKKELVNIKPSKQISIKLKSDNTKVSKVAPKEIVMSKFLVKKKK